MMKPLMMKPTRLTDACNYLEDIHRHSYLLRAMDGINFMLHGSLDARYQMFR